MVVTSSHVCFSFLRGGVPGGGYMALERILFLQEQIKGIIIIVHYSQSATPM